MTEPAIVPNRPVADYDELVWWWDHSVTKFLRRNVGLSLAAATTMLVLLRVLGAAHFDPIVAQAMITATDSPRVLLGVAVSVVPTAALFAAVMSWVWVIGRRSIGRSIRFSLPVALVAALFAAASAPSLLAAGLLGSFAVGRVVTLLVALAARVWARLRGHEPTTRKQESSALGLDLIIPWGLALGAVALFFSGTPWVPAELDVVSGMAEVVYTIDRSDGWAVLLRDADRELQIVRDSEITGRTICSTDRASRSIFELLIGAPKVAPCP